LANTSAPFGFRQFGMREGSAPTAGFDRMFISSGYTGVIFTGDVVMASTTAPYVVSAGSTSGGVANAITSQVTGIFLGCRYYNSNVSRTVWNSYWPGSGAIGDVEAYVCTNPEELYIVQGSTGGVLGSSVVGFVVPMSITNSSLGNTTTGQSVMTVQSSLVTGLSTAGQFKIVDIYSNYAPPGVNGTSTGTEGWQVVVVQPNNTYRKTQSAVVSFST
jgi:hypothetical protein